MECPELEVLSGELTAEIAAHVAGCEPCALVVEMSRERVWARACARFEDLLAVRGALPAAAAAELEAHLATCVACRAIADTMAPIDLPKVATLPVVPVTTYAFGREVARGGMGRVVAAQDLRIGRPVAVKELLDSSPSTAARFEREARITARLQHPGIVPIYEIGTWPDGTPFYAMRLVEGKTLSAALAEADNRLALLPSVIAACEAVAFAHAHDVIHRDLKPSNIMVGAFGETVVIDWGLAKTLDDADDRDVGPYRSLPGSDLTAVGEVMGTAAYMPPEQANAEPVDRRADVYSLGAILYHLLAGQAPYVGATSREIVEKVRTGPPAPLPASAPRDLASIVSKALARKPEDRYANAGELAAELQRFQTGRVVEAHDYSRGERVRRWVRRYRAAVIGSVAALVALLVAGSIGLAGVLRERDRADEQRDLATTHATREHQIAVDLLEEQGRQELLAGHEQRALAYFDAALTQGKDTPALRFMLARAMTGIERQDETLTCNASVAQLKRSPDGNRLIALCGETIHVWELPSKRALFAIKVAGAVKFVLPPHGDWIAVLGTKAVVLDAAGVPRELGATPSGAGFASDDEVIVGYRDGHVQRTQFLGTTSPVPLALKPGEYVTLFRDDGRIAVARTLAGEVRIFDVRTGRALAGLSPGPALIDVVASSNGRTVASCGLDHRVFVWKRDTVAYELHGQPSPIVGCGLSPSGRRLITASNNGQCTMWNLDTSLAIGTFNCMAMTKSIAYSSDEAMVVLGELDQISVVSVETATVLARYPARTTRPRTEFADGNRTIYVGDGTSVVSVAVSSPQIASFVPAPSQRLVAMSARGDRAITVDKTTGVIGVWRTDSGQRLFIPHMVTDPAIGEDSQYSLDLNRGLLAAWNGTDAAVAVDLDTGAEHTRAPMTKAEVLELSGDVLIMRGAEGSLIWNGKTKTMDRRFADGSIVAMLSPDGRHALAYKFSATATTWNVSIIDLESPVPTASFATPPFSPVGYDRSGRRFAVREEPGVSAGGSCVVYDAETGKRLSAQPAESATFDPAHEHLLISDGGISHVMRLADATLTGEFSAGESFLLSLDSTGAFAAGMFENTAHLAIFSTRDGRALAVFDDIAWDTELDSGRLYTPMFAPHWVPDQPTVVVEIGHGSVWKFPLETRPAADIHALISKRVPWRVVDGKIVAVLGQLRGTIKPAAAQLVTATRAPDGSVYRATADAAGHFTFEHLPVGTYAVKSGTAAANVNIDDFEPVNIDLVAP